LNFRLPQSEFLNLTRSKARIPDFDPITRSPRSILIFKKNQNDVILVKQKKQKPTGCNRVFDRVTPDFDFLYFFLNSAWFQPRVGRVQDRPAGPGFKTMTTVVKSGERQTTCCLLIFFFQFFWIDQSLKTF
jgi:hypothetical protein